MCKIHQAMHLPEEGGDAAGVIEIFLEQARSGGPITVHGDVQQTRDFIHVDDVQAIWLAAETDHVGEASTPGRSHRSGFEI